MSHGSRIAYACLSALILFSLLTPAYADCMSDLKGRVICDRGQCVSDIYGEVYCSRYKDGAATKDRFGKVLCAKGMCVTTVKGDIICSARPGGDAMIDFRGKVTCEGGCEKASIRFCGKNSNTAQ